MNGALMLATLDGANVEIRDTIGKANVFIFGIRAEKVEETRHNMRLEKIPMDARLADVLKLLRGNTFGDPKDWTTIIDSISRGNDYYLVNADFPLYCTAQEEVSAAYKDQTGWLRRSIFSIARSGVFSSDRTIMQYAKEIWDIEPARRPGQTTVSVAELAQKGIVPAGVQEALGCSPATLHAPLVKMEAKTSPSAAKYSSVIKNVEVGFDPKASTERVPDGHVPDV
jgi:hypothetical protein